jgi:DNA modification methylase
LKPKDIIGIPWRVAFALQADGWYLRQDIIWHKPNPMPESVTDRCTKAHEYIFLLSKSARYYYDYEAVKEPSTCYGTDVRSDLGNIRYEGKRTKDTTGKNGQQSFVTINDTRNKRSVWTVSTKPFSEAHFATFPEELISPCVLAGCPEGGLVYDPFMGAGTTAYVAKKLGRHFLGSELNTQYIEIANRRINSISESLFI